ncbi:MAG: amino acid adenylation domain-containing protein [Gloeotrichia echinulata CP02]
MTIVDFLSRLQSLGIKVWLEGEQLSYRASKGVMTAALKAELVQRKTEIIAFLKEAKIATQATAAPIVAVDRKGLLPLSYAQQRMWFLHQLDSNNPAYNESIQLRLNGKLNITALEQSIHNIIRRHESLRTAFITIDGKPFQKINPSFTITLPVVDLQNLSEIEVENKITQEVCQPFNLETGDLSRFKLLRVGEDSHILVITMHHIITDGWSMGILLKELSSLYPGCQEIAANVATVLPDLNIQYGDFVVWQRQNITGELLERQLDYWKQQLADAPPLLELPTDKPRPPIQSFVGATQEFKIDLNLTTQLKSISQQSGATLFHTLLTAFVSLLYRYSGQNDISIGCPIANRNHTEIESLIGFFVNTVVLRHQIPNNCSFSQLLAQVRQVALAADANQDVPFEEVVEALHPERSLSYNPLFQVMFAWENFSLDTWELPDLTLTPQIVERGISQFDLSLSVWETKQELIARWEYSSDLYTADTITRMTGHLQTLLSAIVINPDQSIHKLPLLTEKEQEQVLVLWNQTETDYPKDKCIHQLFAEQVERTPEAIALIYDNQKLTYQQLNTKANQLAHYLQSLGVKPEDLVGICVERSPELIISLLAVLKAGAAYVPLDPNYPSERLAYIIKDAQVSVLLTKQHLVDIWCDDEAKIIYLDKDQQILHSQSQENPVSEVQPENLAYVIYTSGSTGQPKGVTIEHRSVVNFIEAAISIYGISQNDRILQFATINFDAAVEEIYSTLFSGATLILRTEEMLNSLSTFMQKCREWEITILDLPTAYWQQLTTELVTTSVSLPQTLRRVIIGGEAASPATLKLWQKYIEFHIQRYQLSEPPRLLNTYGPTEATVVTTIYQLPTENIPPLLPIGKPIANSQTYILDQYLQPLPIGIPGELYIGGIGLARGYLNRPDLTQQNFVVYPLNNSRLYKTGDLARYLPDGNIEFLGRVDHQVKLRGFRIELGEIEAVLTTYPQVKAAVVILREDTPGIKRLVAYLVTSEKSSNHNQLRDFLQQKLPDYMVPSAFVVLDTLPLTPNGKIDRRALPVPTISNDSEQFAAPRTPTEEVLTGIWQEVLRLEKVGIHDNFFELGGDSIISIQIIARANQKGIQITTKQLFKSQTIAQLASVANTNNSIQAEQGLVTGEVTITPIQHWFFEENWQEPHYFNQAMMLAVPADIKSALLEQVIQQLMIHHDALRMRFIKDELKWQQINSDEYEFVPFEVIDFSTLPEAEQSVAIESKASELQGTLNLAAGPMLRVVLFQLGSEKPARLLLIIQHLVVDGVSWRILFDDLVTAYRQLEQGEAVKLPHKTTSFQYWSSRQYEYGQSKSIEQEFNHWLAQTSSNIEPFPVDYAFHKAANTEASSTEISVFLTEEETRILLQDVPSVYNTQINDLVLTALVQTFAQWTGSPSLLIDLEGHGREELFDDVDLSRTVGWFTTIYPVLLDLGTTSSPTEALKTIKEQLRRIPHHGIGYGILRYLGQNQNISQQLQMLPKAELCFNYLGQFDQIRSEPILLGFAPESVGKIFSPKSERSHLLDVVGMIVESQLEIIWIYSENVHRRETIDRLANDYISVLKALIEYCMSSAVGGYTPSDFPDAGLSQDELDNLLAEI